MGRCIICGAAVEGRICDTHEEDVVFEFRGSRPDQLVPGRYYEGTVDGYADFGIFVDVGEEVTGLLHESELDRRLESLDWEPGDTVYVQVLRVRDNGNVDLGWSIRQREADFRGVLVQDPDADEPETAPGEADRPEATRTNGGGDAGTAAETAETAEAGPTPEPGSDERDGVERDGVERRPSEEATGAADEEPERVAVEALSDRVGDRIVVEGEVVGVRQTGGPTIFEVRDGTGTVDVAAFAGAGARAHPEVGADDVVRVVGEVERRREELQVESEAVERLSGDDAAAVHDRLEAALAAEARPDGIEPLAGHEPVASVREALSDAAEAIRRAVLEARPVVVRHTATADGYVAGAAIERAALPLVREEHARSDAEYHYFDRRPLEDPVYGMDDATNDVTDMLEGRDRHDEKLPLVVLVDAGAAAESRAGLELLDVYGVERVVVDAAPVASEVADAASTVVSPASADADDAPLTTTALAANLAAAVNPGVREDLRHLPAVSYWEDPPGEYVELAAEAGYDADDARELREAVALEAFYQTYEDKRELIADLLFGDDDGDARGLAAHVSEQFREKLGRAVETARANVEVRSRGGARFTVLDAERFAHRYDFPPTHLLADALHRRERDGRGATVVVTADELHLRSEPTLDLRELAEPIAEDAPEAGVRAVGGRPGRLQFLAGEREAVLEAALSAVADALA